MKKVKFPKRNAYGALPIDPLLLIQNLDRSWRKGTRVRIPSTKKIFNCLQRMGGQLLSHPESKAVVHDGMRDWTEVKSFYRGNGKKCREFLIDFLWSQKRFGTLLACESEMRDRLTGMQHDFEKILCWKAPLKLMIVQDRGVPAREIADGLASYANDNVHQFVKRECFLLFVFGSEGNHAYGHIASGSTTETFDFVEIPLPLRRSSTA